MSTYDNAVHQTVEDVQHELFSVVTEVSATLCIAFTHLRWSERERRRHERPALSDFRSASQRSPLRCREAIDSQQLDSSVTVASLCISSLARPVDRVARAAGGSRLVLWLRTVQKCGSFSTRCAQRAVVHTRLAAGLSSLQAYTDRPR